jgi:hypothetical protein
MTSAQVLALRALAEADALFLRGESEDGYLEEALLDSTVVRGLYANGWVKHPPSWWAGYTAPGRLWMITDAGLDALARQEVEGSLQAAGIIEDPDLDGGLLG